MKFDGFPSTSSEKPLTTDERVEFEQLGKDELVQTYLRLMQARASAPFLGMPGIDVRAAQEAQSAGLSAEISRLLAQDREVGIRAERFLALQRRTQIS